MISMKCVMLYIRLFILIKHVLVKIKKWSEYMKIIKCKNGNIMMVLKEVEDVTDKMIYSNDVDASFEKHVPQMERYEDKVEVFVNHVMEDDHYIEWILVDYGKEQVIKHFLPGEDPRIVVDYQAGMKAYSYCNKHSLWVSESI